MYDHLTLAPKKTMTAIASDTANRPGGVPTQTTIAIERLRADIVSGRLRPNEKLRVQALAEHYGFAASALREALSRLVTDALVVVEDQRGFRVSPVSRESLIELTDARVGIECLAIRRAIQFGDVAWESSVIGAYHRLSRCSEIPDPNSQDMLQWSRCHQDFHQALIAACRSKWLLYFTNLLYQQSERYRMLATLTKPKRKRNVPKEHEELMNAVVERDADRACTLIEAHFQETTRLLLEADDMRKPAALKAKRATRR
jgi:DNA-binding GntR family transcriptional regulator